MKLTTTCLLVLCWLLPANTRADTIFAFTSAFSTFGTFGCKSSLPCTGQGTNTLTVQSSTGTATLMFTGVNSIVNVTNGLTPVTLGTISLSATPGFIFPGHPANAELPALFFSLTITQTSPVAASNFVDWGFDGTRPDLTVKSGREYMTLPAGPPYAYPEFVYTFDPFPVRIFPNASTRATANVGAVPEPASLLLLGSALAGAALARRRKRAR